VAYPGPMARPTAVLWVLLWLGFAALALLLYAPALRGAFIADDLGYVLNNEFIQTLDLAHVIGIFEPWGDASLFTANYAPIHLLGHALQWQAFGALTFGYHVTNVVLHAGVSVLLGAVFLWTGVPRSAALLLGALFLVHPANVETVAWIFQLKTILALGFSLIALLMFERRPALSALFLALAILSKIAAAYALPVMAALLWTRAGAGRREWGWLAVWAVIFVVCALPEFIAFDRLGHAVTLERYPDAAAQVRSMVGIGGRYLVMGFTSWGISPSHEPAPALSWTDPWWLFGLLAVTILGWRTWVTLRARKMEAVWWIWAAAGFAPVSQIFPFLYPMADRYLYFILPGLMGGAFFAVAGALGVDTSIPSVVTRIDESAGDDAADEEELSDAAAAASTAAAEPASLADRAWVAAGAALVVVFAILSFGQTPIWQTEARMVANAAVQYPNGIGARWLRARNSAELGDRSAALEELRALAETGFDGFMILQQDPAFARLATTRQFQEIVAQVANNWVSVASQRTRHVQPELRHMALAYLTMGDKEGARRAYRMALEQGGSMDAQIRAELARLGNGGS
jgi:hypothetical protein